MGAIPGRPTQKTTILYDTICPSRIANRDRGWLLELECRFGV